MKKLSLEECVINGICSYDFVETMSEVYSEEDILIFICKEFLKLDFEEIAKLFYDYDPLEIEYIYNMIKYDYEPIPGISFRSNSLGWVESTRFRNM